MATLPPIPKKTPEVVETERLQLSTDDQAKLNELSITSVDADKIKNATPSSLKAMGIAKLPLLLLVIGNQVSQIIEPALENLIKTHIKEFTDKKSCPTPFELDKIKKQRDSIVEQLNKVGKTLNIISLSLTGIATFLSILETALKGIEVAKIAAKILALTNPASAAALPVLLNTLDSTKQSVLIDAKGNSRLVKLDSIIGGAALVASIIASYILAVTILLKSIDIFLEKCDPNTTLIPISKDIQDIADTQLQASQTQNQTTYIGFIIEIEEVPYTSTVTRRRALGKNQQGIVLIQTELSFTTDEQTLINELKLIIDRDNLKAY